MISVGLSDAVVDFAFTSRRFNPAHNETSMKVGLLKVVSPRTVRVADGRTPSNLPLSLGRMRVYHVKECDGCPEVWEDGGVFAGLHDVEAIWMSFPRSQPVAVLCGAGGVNALTGLRLFTKREKGGYLVTPPQPGLDGWKVRDGTVYQFPATPHKAGKGLSVGEQILGGESKTGSIGIAVFESKASITPKPMPREGWGTSAYDARTHWLEQLSAGEPIAIACSSAGAHITEMGLVAGRSSQKIRNASHGLKVWQDAGDGGGDLSGQRRDAGRDRGHTDPPSLSSTRRTAGPGSGPWTRHCRACRGSGVRRPEASVPRRHPRTSQSPEEKE